MYILVSRVGLVAGVKQANYVIDNNGRNHHLKEIAYAVLFTWAEETMGKDMWVIYAS